MGTACLCLQIRPYVQGGENSAMIMKTMRFGALFLPLFPRSKSFGMSIGVSCRRVWDCEVLRGSCIVPDPARRKALCLCYYGLVSSREVLYLCKRTYYNYPSERRYQKSHTLRRVCVALCLCVRTYHSGLTQCAYTLCPARETAERPMGARDCHFVIVTSFTIDGTA